MDNKLLIRDGFSLINFKLVQSIGLDETILLGYIHSKQLYFCGKNELTKEGYFYQYREDIAKNTSITFKRQKKAFDHLEELGFEVQSGNYAGALRVYYIDKQAEIDNVFAKYLE